MLCSGIGISLYNGWVLTLVILAAMPFMILAWTKNIKIRQVVFSEHKEIYEESDQKAQETLGAIKLVKQMNA
jgi:ABC-type bacteriocin/lantibiotic exporter with double-glycine peptidase domain